jgi:uncharacterized protein (TIGR02588 family)
MKKKPQRVRKNLLEWAVFGVSLALVAGTLSFLIYDGANAGDTPPDLHISLEEAVQRGDRFVIPVTVWNEGGETAEGVQVEVSLEGQDGAQVERGEFSIPFLPRSGRRKGFVTFRTDPRSARPVPRILGYEKP